MKHMMLTRVSCVVLLLLASESVLQGQVTDQETSRPVDLRIMREKWIDDEERRVQQLMNESFETSLDMMVDWVGNYYKIVHADASPEVARPSSLRLILYSRRFAKLLEETQGELSERQIEPIISCLREDLIHWRELLAGGQNLRSASRPLQLPDHDSSDLIRPLTFRINAMVLLIGERSIEQGLPLVLEAVDTIGIDTNWSCVAYACDKILSTKDLGKLKSAQKGILDEYLAWKAALENKSFSSYKVIDLPSFRSARRPYERATSMGVGVDFSEGKVSAEVPPIYPYCKVGGPDVYLDPTGTTPIAKQIIAFARKLQNAGD